MASEAGSHPAGYLFAVADKPMCCWDFDLVPRTRKFLEGVETGYYEQIATTWAPYLEGDAAEKNSAAIALRCGYLQGVETLMSFIGAFVQAPHALPVWIASCGTSELRKVVARLRTKEQLLTHVGPQALDFEAIANQLFGSSAMDASLGPVVAEFGRFWKRLASDFLDPKTIDEYNSLKHGLRIRPGGISIVLGPQVDEGEQPSAGGSVTLRGTDTGSTLLRVERLDGYKGHVRTVRQTLNWSAEDMAARLQLISRSISNLTETLMLGLSPDISAARLWIPDDLKAFDEAFNDDHDLVSSSMDSKFALAPAVLDHLTSERILAELRQRKPPSS